MIRTFFISVCLVALAACGGGTRYSSANAQSGGAGAPAPTFDGTTTRLPFATGPIYAACQAGGRRAASQARCGCVQAVADQALSRSDQRRGAGYFKDPHALQEVRQSDNAGNERFWKAWKAYGQQAAEICARS